MTPGLLVLLLVLAAAECVALVLRRRAITHRRWDAEESDLDVWLAQLRQLGMASREAGAATSELAEAFARMAS